jgi:hypothetical protein
MNVTKEGGKNPIRPRSEPDPPPPSALRQNVALDGNPRRHREFVALAINRFCAFHPWRVTQKNHYLMACWGFIPFSGLAWLSSGA